MSEPRRKPGRPPVGPLRTLRMGDLWDEAAALAADHEETMTALVTRAVEREVRRLKRSAPTPDEK